MKNKTLTARPSTRERIIDKAFSLFSVRGIKDISMREIAAACGVTKPVIYYYFKDKDALCIEMVKYVKSLHTGELRRLAGENPLFGKFLEKIFSGALSSGLDKRILGLMPHLHSYISSRPQLCKIIGAPSKNEPAEIIKQKISGEVKAGRLPGAMRGIALNLIHAASMHMVLEAYHGRVKISKKYPADITKAILRGICYKGDIR